MPAIVQEEERLLSENRRTLLEHQVIVGARDKEIVEEMQRLRAEIAHAKTEDQGALMEQYQRLYAVLRQLRAGRTEDEVDPDSPYFGHLCLQEEGRVRHLFLGKATRLDHGLRIVDWRNAPISRIFYLYREDDEYAEEIGERVLEGRVAARRTVSIHRGTLNRVAAPQGTFVRDGEGWRQLEAAPRLEGGEAASFHHHTQSNDHRRSLGGVGGQIRPDKHLPDIAALIDPEQFELITRPESGLVVIRGGAGSGKTTVALHRVAYLVYADRRRFRADRMRVLVWGRALRDYISQVLPGLGVPGVPVQTWPDWAASLVRKHYPFLPRARASDTPGAVSRLKTHPAMMGLLQEVVDNFNHNRSARGAFDDWLTLFADLDRLRAGVARHAPGAFTDAEIERVWEWHRQQRSPLYAWVDGDRSERAELDAEDDALLLRLYQLRVGRLTQRGRKPLAYSHVVIDEVQDLAPLEILVTLGALDERRCITLAGDTQQHIIEQSGFASWDDLLASLGIEGTEISTLRVSYRSTRQIMEFAVGLLGELAEDEIPARTTREGAPVEFFRFSDHGAAVGFLAEVLADLMIREPMASVAMITPHAGLSRLYAQGLTKAEVPCRQVIDQRFSFEPGIEVTEISEVKGLEFDYVVLIEASASNYPDDSHKRRLLHVGATRAAHQLWLTSVATPSPILPQSRG